MNQNVLELAQLGDECFKRGDFRHALSHFEDVAARVQQGDETIAKLEDIIPIPMALGNLGEFFELEALSQIATVLGNLGELESMLKAATRLLRRAREVDNEAYQMIATLWMTGALGEMDLRNRWHELKPLLLEGLAIARRLGDYFSEFEVLNLIRLDYEVQHLMRLGGYAVEVGEYEQGLAWLQAALNAVGSDTSIRSYYLRLTIYRYFSLLMRRRGDNAEAVRYFDTEAIIEYLQRRYPLEDNQALNALAHVILSFTNGHPQEVCDIVDDLRREHPI